MAFVFKSSRKFNYIDSTENEKPGPGHYISIDNQYSNISKNKIPFLSAEKKLAYKESDSPGPGTYYTRNENLENNILISKDNNATIYKVLDYDEVAKNSKFAKLLQEKMNPTGFLIKDKRFNKKIEDDNPGPGYYNRNDLNYFEQSTNKIEKEKIKKELSKAKTNTNFYKNRENAESLFTENNKFQGPVSIPSNYKVFGYKLNEKGAIVNNDNKKETAELGPCTYEIYNKTMASWTDKANLTGLWSKSKAYKLEMSPKEKQEKEMLKTNSTFYNTGSDFRVTQHQSNISTANITNQFNSTENQFKPNNTQSFRDYSLNKTLHNKFKMLGYYTRQVDKENRKKLATDKTSEIDKLIESVENTSPGPGYYFPNNLTNYEKSVSEGFQCFGSRTSRFNPFIVGQDNYQPGPGSYFRKNDIVQTKKRVKVAKSKNKLNRKRVYSLHNNKSNSLVGFGSAKRSTTFDQNSIFEKNNSPGPGYYNTSSNWNKANDETSKAIFGSTETRFVPKKSSQCNTPYLPIFDYNKKFEVRVNPMKQIKKSKLHEDILESNGQQKHIIVNKDIKPSVGSYNPDKTLNIDFKLHKNVSKVSTVYAPFNSLQRRFEKAKKEAFKLNVGPGYYYKDKRVVMEQNGPAFKSTSKRKELFNGKSNIGPGKYNLNSWFDWNKKTYNISYI